MRLLLTLYFLRQRTTTADILDGWASPREESYISLYYIIYMGFLPHRNFGHAHRFSHDY